MINDKNIYKRFSVKDKCILITGASSGIGRHAVDLFINLGAKVIISARRKHKLNNILNENKEFKDKLFAYTLDISNTKNIKKSILDIEINFGPIDVLINNAGVTESKPIFSHSIEDWNKVLDVNLSGAWKVSQEVAYHMSKRKNLPKGGGSIINITSTASIRNLKNVPSYIASKAGLSQLTKYMAMELAENNIRVNSIAPGFFLTELSYNYLNTERGKKSIKKVPMQRIGALEELDGALLLLSSNMGSYITGAEIFVDGGMSTSSI